MNITKLRHPDYNMVETQMYRLIKDNTADYINDYLEHYSLRESVTGFTRRKRMTYSPAYAKADVGEIQLSITNRLTDVRRETNDASYMNAIDGLDGGVDNTGSSMNQFIGSETLSELLFMKKVGVFVDMPSLPEHATKADVPYSIHPYCYIYKIEDILIWTIGPNKLLRSVLLRYEEDILHAGLTIDRVVKYRHLTLTSEGVTEVIYNQHGQELSFDTTDLPEIPFFIAELSQSLLKDVARQQNTLLNLASSDVHYCIESNFPFMTEQHDAAVTAFNNLPTRSVAENTKRDSEEKGSTTPEVIDVGPTRGRRYPKEMDRPKFIHPSPEPLEISMKKQDSIRAEIRTLMHLSLSGITNDHAANNDRGLNYGLKAIGDELEKLERFIMRMWSYYMDTALGSVHYPEDYTLKTPEERLKEAEQLLDILKASPSKTFQREMQKKIIALMFLSDIDHKDIEKMLKEIEAADILYVHPESLINDVAAGLVTTNFASEVRGYPQDEADKALEQRVERAAATLLAQKRIADAYGGVGSSDPQGSARGVDDLEIDLQPGESSATIEKQTSQSASISIDGNKKVRGDA